MPWTRVRDNTPAPAVCISQAIHLPANLADLRFHSTVGPLAEHTGCLWFSAPTRLLCGSNLRPNSTLSAHSGLSHWLAGMSAMSPVRLVVVDSQEMRRSSKSNRHRPFSFNDAPFAVFSPLPRSGVRPPWNGCDRVMRGQGRQGCPSCADTGIWQNRRSDRSCQDPSLSRQE